MGQHEWYCPNCKDKYDHAKRGDPSSAASRPFLIKLTRVVKPPEMEIGGCVVCRSLFFITMDKLMAIAFGMVLNMMLVAASKIICDLTTEFVISLRKHDFSAANFSERTVMLCDQVRIANPFRSFMRAWMLKN